MISADFLASYSCIKGETEYAMERHKRGEAIVVPCICRKVASLKGYGFEPLKRVPTDGKSINSYRSIEDGCVEAVKMIKELIVKRFFSDAKDNPAPVDPVDMKEKSRVISNQKTESTAGNVKKTDSISETKSEVSLSTGGKRVVSENGKKPFKSISNNGRSTSGATKKTNVDKVGIVLYNEGLLKTINVNQEDIAKLPEFYKNVSDLNNHLKNYTKDAVSTYKNVLNSKKYSSNTDAKYFKMFLMEICTGIRRYITDGAGVRVHFRGDNGKNYVGIIASTPLDYDDTKVNWNVTLTPIPRDNGLIYYSLKLHAPLLKSLNKTLNYKGQNDDIWPEYYTEALSFENNVVLSLGISFNKEQYKQKQYLMYFLTLTRFGDLVKSHIDNYVIRCQKINSDYRLDNTVNKLLVLGD